jgi:diacylglycerol kinase family enzyme
MTRRVHVLVNPGARQVGAAKDIEVAYAPLRDAVDDVVVEECRHGEDLAPRAREVAKGGATTVVAAGGDGTVSAVASALVGGDVPLGVLPLGTLNHFAQDAGLPLTLPEAAAVTVSGGVRHVDVGFAGERPFINTATLGVYFDIVTTRERWQPRVGKHLATLIGTLHAFRHPPLLKLDLVIDGENLRARVPVMWAGNNRYTMEWPKTGTRTRLDEGLLTLVLVHDTSRTAFLRQVYRVLVGRSHLARDIEMTHPREIVVTKRRMERLRIALDGERMLLDAPLKITVREKSLPLMVPREAEVRSSEA